MVRITPGRILYVMGIMNLVISASAFYRGIPIIPVVGVSMLSIIFFDIGHRIDKMLKEMTA